MVKGKANFWIYLSEETNVNYVVVVNEEMRKWQTYCIERTSKTLKADWSLILQADKVNVTIIMVTETYVNKL